MYGEMSYRMKSFVVSFIVSLLLLTSCQWTSRSAMDSTTESPIEVERFDRLESRYLLNGDYAAMQQMNTEYPTCTQLLFEKMLNLGKVTDASVKHKFRTLFQDSVPQAILSAVDKEFTSMTDIDRQLDKACNRLKHILTDFEVPEFYAQIGTLNQSIVVQDKLVGISLDKYLGVDFPPYETYFTPEQRLSMTRAYIVPDCLCFYLLSQYPTPDEEAPKEEQDFHMGKIMWIVNKALGKRFFKNPDVSNVETYMQRNKHTSAKELLESVNLPAVQ